jgi:hypothetical protein
MSDEQQRVSAPIHCCKHLVSVWAVGAMCPYCCIEQLEAVLKEIADYEHPVLAHPGWDSVGPALCNLVDTWRKKAREVLHTAEDLYCQP